MATHSGLTRWQDFSPVDKDISSPEDHFSKLYPRAIDEVWYKRAVEQYYVNPDSFVFSVPLEDEGADNTTLVTATRAVFIENKGKKGKAPAMVVGFQFQHTALQALFQNITYNCDGCQKDQKEQKEKSHYCGDGSWACYLIDNNGYIIAAEDETDVGKFFGEVRGPIMSSLVRDGVFERIRIFDYQAVCFKSSQTNNAGNILLNPWKHFQKALSWMIGQAAWAWAKAGVMDSDDAEAYYVSDDESAGDYHVNEDKPPPVPEKEGGTNFDQNILINRTRPEVCDKEIYLYLRNASFDSFDMDMNCEYRWYMVQPVSYSNMLLVVVNTVCGDTTSPTLNVKPEEVIYENNTLVCQKTLIGLKRKRPQSCIRTHPDESRIRDQCGLATSTRSNLLLLILLLMCALGKSTYFLG